MTRDKEQWRQDAACRHTDPDLFFPISPGGKGVEQIAAAKALCENCRVLRSCLEFAMRTRQAHGVWGGTTEDERTRTWRRETRGADSVAQEGLRPPMGEIQRGARDSLAG